MTSTKIRTTLARLDVVDSIKEVLNSEICYCPIHHTLCTQMRQDDYHNIFLNACPRA